MTRILTDNKSLESYQPSPFVQQRPTTERLRSDPRVRATGTRTAVPWRAQSKNLNEGSRWLQKEPGRCSGINRALLIRMREFCCIADQQLHFHDLRLYYRPCKWWNSWLVVEYATKTIFFHLRIPFDAKNGRYRYANCIIWIWESPVTDSIKTKASSNGKKNPPKM
jgi:hypothetical protein